MTFYSINFIYIGLWIFVFLGFLQGASLDYLCPNYDTVKKVNLHRFSKFFKMNKAYKPKMWIKSFIMQLTGYIYIVISFFLTIISLFQTLETTILIISIYFLASLIYFIGGYIYTRMY
ncbi:MAG: hypothetical protein CVV60_03610 [Tenericutes bacterium HGW-Tenericutes-5]|nr:MAG: hypothetical protein CVV60_03610 [Tenericutes bacterium HGW-Tenericutes-5]